MSKLSFNINSIEEERVVCDNSLRNIEFYEKHKIIFTLPRATIEEEYDIKRYEEFVTFLKKSWSNKDNEIINRLLVFFNKNKDTGFTVNVSNYGVLGSYSDKHNNITLNRCIKDIDFDPIRIIKHEIVHILVEPYMKEYSIDHEKKESIVNDILGMIKD